MQKKFGILLIVNLLAIVLLLMVGQSLAYSPLAVSSNTSGFVTEYPISVTNGKPQNIVVASAGSPASVWFTMPAANAIGNLVVTSTVDFQFKTFTAGISPNSAPYDLAYDANRNLIWFTEKDGNRLGALNIATGVITETAVPTNESPRSIAVSDDGKVWFTEPEANQLTRFDPSVNPSIAFTYYTYANDSGTTVNGQPTKIAILDNDSIWITAPNANQIARFKPSTSQFSVGSVSDFGSPPFPPSDIAILDTTAWVASPTNDRIGRYVPQTLAGFQWFSLPSTNSGINSLDVTQTGSSRQLWFTEPNYGRVGRISLTSNYKVSRTMLQNLLYPASVPSDITVDTQGTAWIADNGGQAIAQWVAPYNYGTFLPAVLNQ